MTHILTRNLGEDLHTDNNEGAPAIGTQEHVDPASLFFIAFQNDDRLIDLRSYGLLGRVLADAPQNFSSFFNATLRETSARIAESASRKQDVSTAAFCLQRRLTC